MKPSYRDHYVPEPDLVMFRLRMLNWLQVTEARLEYFMSDIARSYIYGKGVGQREYFSCPYSDEVAAIQWQLNKESGTKYNVCFLNRYDHQHHQLGWHSDDSPTMDHDHPIAVISFGAEREIWTKPIGAKGVVPPEDRQRLGHGSLFVMPAGFQQHYQHRIPKADRAVGCRISLTFRRYL